jgi:hypothetical protein
VVVNNKKRVSKMVSKQNIELFNSINGAHFGKGLEVLRYGYKQRELCIKIGMVQPVYSRYESGFIPKTRIKQKTIDNISSICKHHGKTIKQIEAIGRKELEKKVIKKSVDPVDFKSKKKPVVKESLTTPQMQEDKAESDFVMGILFGMAIIALVLFIINVGA